MHNTDDLCKLTSIFFPLCFLISHGTCKHLSADMSQKTKFLGTVALANCSIYEVTCPFSLSTFGITVTQIGCSDGQPS